MAALNSLYQTQHCVEATAVDKALCEFMSTDAKRSTMDREGSLCFSNWTLNNKLVPNRKRRVSRQYIVTLLI